jgi:hypothetical protein
MTLHIGRSWRELGHPLEDECPCPKAECGLVISDQVVEECLQHPWGRAKTMRQGHDAEACDRSYS